MSECVIRMEMPTKDMMCRMADDIDGVWYCPVMKKLCRQPDNGEIPSWCPIICQLPEGHGRLVDERELFTRCRPVKNFDNTDTLVIVKGAVMQSKTIVPDERSKT